MTLTELFRPVSVTEIRDAFDCGELHHFRRGSDRNQAEAVMNWEIAAHIAERKAEKPGKLRILNDGVPVPSEMMKTSPASAEVSGAKLRLLIRQGVCFVATEIEEFGADLRSLALDAERHFGCPVTLGAIATFGRGFALRPHWDESDIIIIQVAGRKTWNISGQRHTGRMDVHRQTAPTEITREFTMEPGDLAVIPRGMWHRCHSEEDNLQFSVLLTRQTGADFIQDLAKQALRDPLFHRAVPLSRDRTAMAALEAEWLARFRELAADGSLPRFLEATDRALDIPFCFDRTPVDPADPGAVLSLVARRRIAPPAGPDEPLRMGGMSLPVTPAILAAVAILNEEVSTPASEIFRRLASSFSRDEIADAIRALDESCFARLHKPGLHT